MIKEWITALVPEEWRTAALWLSALLLVLIFWALSRFYHDTLHPRLQRVFQRHEHLTLFAVLSDNFYKPITWFILLLGLVFAASTAPVGTNIVTFFSKLLRLYTIAAIGWGLAGSSRLIAYFMRDASKKLDINTNHSVISFLSSLFKVIVYAFVAVILLGELGYDVNGLVAGLGLGGLTVALAAQSSASNFFAGLVLIFDKPFVVGDCITYGDTFGTVEGIAFRTTRIRTLSDTIVTVPNAKLCDSPITNWTQMRKRLAKFTIGLRYDTPSATIQIIIEQAEAMLRANSDILPESVSVRLTEFGDSSLNLLVRFCTADPAYESFLKTSEAVNFELIRIVHECGSDFAFPSRSIYMEQ